MQVVTSIEPDGCGAWQAKRPAAKGRLCRWARWDEDANANAGFEKEEQAEGNESSR